MADAPQRALLGPAELEAVSEAMGALHERYHGRRPATIRTQMMR